MLLQVGAVEWSLDGRRWHPAERPGPLPVPRRGGGALACWALFQLHAVPLWLRAAPLCLRAVRRQRAALCHACTAACQTSTRGGGGGGGLPPPLPPVLTGHVSSPLPY